MKTLLLATALGFGTLAGAARAGDLPASADPVIARIEAEGYALIETKMSWLGRIVVLSQRDGRLREVVLNRATGAVVSDRLFEPGSAPRGQPSDPGATAGQRQSRDGGSGGERSGGNDSPRN